MDQGISLHSPVGDFELIPDPDCRMVYVDAPHSAPTAQAREIPAWFFDPETIWFDFNAPAPEDKVAAGNKIKIRLEDLRSRI